MQFNLIAVFTTILAATTTLAAPTPLAQSSIEKRDAASTIAGYCNDVINWCNSQGTLCDKVCTVGMGALAGVTTGPAGGLIGAIWCADMKSSVTCAAQPTDDACLNVGRNILNQSLANLGISQAQFEMVKRETNNILTRIQSVAQSAAQAAANKAQSIANTINNGLNTGLNKAKSWSCKTFKIGC